MSGFDAASAIKVIQIPDKLYFKIGEVARIVGVKEYVLRYWETEFPEVAPPKSRGQHRLYRKKNIERLLEIKTLLYEKKFTIEGARNWMDRPLRNREAAPSLSPNAPAPSAAPQRKPLLAIKSRIESLLASLPRK